jgi:hypothetical protein
MAPAPLNCYSGFSIYMLIGNKTLTTYPRKSWVQIDDLDAGFSKRIQKAGREYCGFLSWWKTNS